MPPLSTVLLKCVPVACFFCLCVSVDIEHRIQREYSEHSSDWNMHDISLSGY